MGPRNYIWTTWAQKMYLAIGSNPNPSLHKQDSSFFHNPKP